MIPVVYKAAAILAFCLALLGLGWYLGHHGEAIRAKAQLSAIQTANAQALADAEQAARAQEQAHAAQLATIEQRYEQDKADAQASSDRVIADLRAGNLRLRKQWQCAPRDGVPAAGAGSGQPDAATQLREQGASDLVRLAAEADAEIRALQAVIAADRSK